MSVTLMLALGSVAVILYAIIAGLVLFILEENRWFAYHEHRIAFAVAWGIAVPGLLALGLVVSPFLLLVALGGVVYEGLGDLSTRRKERKRQANLPKARTVD